MGQINGSALVVARRAERYSSERYFDIFFQCHLEDTFQLRYKYIYIRYEQPGLVGEHLKGRYECGNILCERPPPKKNTAGRAQRNAPESFFLRPYFRVRTGVLVFRIFLPPHGAFT